MNVSNQWTIRWLMGWVAVVGLVCWVLKWIESANLVLLMEWVELVSVGLMLAGTVGFAVTLGVMLLSAGRSPPR